MNETTAPVTSRGQRTQVQGVGPHGGGWPCRPAPRLAHSSAPGLCYPPRLYLFGWLPAYPGRAFQLLWMLAYRPLFPQAHFSQNSLVFFTKYSNSGFVNCLASSRPCTEVLRWHKRERGKEFCSCLAPGYCKEGGENQLSTQIIPTKSLASSTRMCRLSWHFKEDDLSWKP